MHLTSFYRTQAWALLCFFLLIGVFYFNSIKSAHANPTVAPSGAGDAGSIQCGAPPVNGQTYTPYSLPKSVGGTVEAYGNTITAIRQGQPLTYPRFLAEGAGPSASVFLLLKAAVTPLSMLRHLML